MHRRLLIAADGFAETQYRPGGSFIVAAGLKLDRML